MKQPILIFFSLLISPVFSFAGSIKGNSLSNNEKTDCQIQMVIPRQYYTGHDNKIRADKITNPSDQLHYIGALADYINCLEEEGKVPSEEIADLKAHLFSFSKNIPLLRGALSLDVARGALGRVSYSLFENCSLNFVRGQNLLAIGENKYGATITHSTDELHYIIALKERIDCLKEQQERTGDEIINLEAHFSVLMLNWESNRQGQILQ